MRKIFKRKEIYKVKSLSIDPATMGEPHSADEYQQRGMAFYARKQFNKAASDLTNAISLDKNHLDAYYCLGMVMKALGRKDEASAAFNQVINLISANHANHTSKFDMLRRLALGHINEMNQGDWNLEKEIWKRIA